MILRGARVSSILITCRNKDAVLKHYEPALRGGGWRGEVHLATPGDPLPPLADFQGLLMTGGDDIHPCRWEPPEPVHREAHPDEARDALESAAVQQAWDLKLPILGICRGEQFLNVARGGSLIQDLPDRLKVPPGRHNRGTSGVPELAHRVRLAPGSRLAGLVGALEVEVNSRHHQAVGRVAPGLRAVAWHPGTTLAGQALVEAVEAVDAARWTVAVQWHPENLVTLEHPAAASALGLFRGFAAALGARP